MTFVFSPYHRVLAWLFIGNYYGRNNYKDTKLLSLLVFNKVYRLEIQSVMLVFSTQLCELLPLYLLSGSPSPPIPPSQSQHTVYTDSVWLRGGRGCWVVLEIMFCRSLTLCFWPDSEPKKLLHHPKQKPRRGGGPQTDKHLKQSPFTGQFLRKPTFTIGIY